MSGVRFQVSGVRFQVSEIRCQKTIQKSKFKKPSKILLIKKIIINFAVKIALVA